MNGAAIYVSHLVGFRELKWRCVPILTNQRTGAGWLLINVILQLILALACQHRRMAQIVRLARTAVLSGSRLLQTQQQTCVQVQKLRNFSCTSLLAGKLKL